MNVIYNGNLIKQDEPFLNSENRAFYYGDGLFETMIFQNGKIIFLEDHLERLSRGLLALKINIPASLNFNAITLEIKKLVKSNNISEKARIKLVVWRKPGGLFTPESNTGDFLITAKELKPLVASPRTLDFCKSVRLSFSPFSQFKTCSSLTYVLAGIELKERGLDDVILLDTDGNVAECLYSNIFWVKGKAYFTPSLETGCIEGIRRKNLINKLAASNIEVNIVKSKPHELLEADYIFLTNVAGFYPITTVGSKKFDFFLPDI